jgi:gentisate 1,2-dioxygenase
VSLYDELMRQRDAQRADRQDAPVVVHARDLPWEANPQGLMRWYLHPSIPNQALRTYLFFVQRIPPAGRSGRQRCQGGSVYYVWRGRGHTVMDGVRHDWQQGDVVQLPLRTRGIIYQHFNDDPDGEALLVACDVNAVHALGVDRGSGLEQLEDAPDFGAGG